MNIEPLTPVLFRVPRSPKKHGSDVTAVFPCDPGDMSGLTMSCYAHIGQHSACSYGWYNETRAATPAEYASLKRELESPPYGYRLEVRQRMTQAHKRALDAEISRLRSLSE